MAIFFVLVMKLAAKNLIRLRHSLMIVIDIDHMPWYLQRRAIRQLPAFRALACNQVAFGVPLAEVHATRKLHTCMPVAPQCVHYEHADHAVLMQLLADAQNDVRHGASLVRWATLPSPPSNVSTRTHHRTADNPNGDDGAWTHVVYIDSLLKHFAELREHTVVLTATRLGPPPSSSAPGVYETFVCVRPARGVRVPAMPRDTNLLGVMRTLASVILHVPVPLNPPAVTACIDVNALLNAQRYDVSPLDARELWFRVWVPRTDRCSRIMVEIRFGLKELATACHRSNEDGEDLGGAVCTTGEWDAMSDAERCRRMADVEEWAASPHLEQVADITMYDDSGETDMNLYDDVAFSQSDTGRQVLAKAMASIGPNIALTVPNDLWLRAPLDHLGCKRRHSEGEDIEDIDMSLWLPLCIRTRLSDDELPPICTILIPERYKEAAAVPLMVAGWPARHTNRVALEEWVPTGVTAAYMYAHHSVHAVVVTRNKHPPHAGQGGAARGRAREGVRKRG